MSFNFVQAQTFQLAGAGAVIGDVTVVLSSLKQIDGTTNITMTNFGAIGYMTLEPNSGTQEEQISFSGIVQNANGTATLSGVKSVLFVSPYTESTGLAKTHAGGTKAIISNTAGFYNKLVAKDDAATITGKYTFPGGGDANAPVSGTVYAAPTADLEYAAKKYVDDTAFGVGVLANTTTAGYVQEATVSQLNAGTATGSTGAVLFGSPADFASSIYGLQLPTSGQKSALVGDNTDIAVGSGNKYMTQTGYQKASEIYGATATGNDTYVVTLTPVPTSYDNGRHYFVKLDVGNTGAATINFNSLGAVSIVTGVSTALVTGDMLATGIYELIYNSTGPVFQLVNPASIVLTTTAWTNGTTTRAMDTASGVQNIPHSLGRIPKRVRFWVSATTATTNFPAYSDVVYNGSTTSGLKMPQTAFAGTPTYFVATSLLLDLGGGTSQEAVITFDATNIILTWTKSGSPPSNAAQIAWEATA